MAKPRIEKMLEYINIVVAPELRKVLNALKRGVVDENELADVLKVRVNDVRKLMYSLSHNGYVKYTKHKSEDKQWWYVYTWTLNKDKIEEDYLSKKRKEINKKNKLLAIEKETEFRCSGCSKRFLYSDALEDGFICSDCEGHLAQIVRRPVAAKLEREIKQLKKDIAIIVGKENNK